MNFDGGVKVEMLGHVVGGSVIVESDVIVGELLSVHFGILGMEAFAEQCRKCGRRWDGRLARRCAPLARSVGGASSRSRIRESLSAQQRASSAGPALCRRHPSRLRQFSRECGTDRCSRGFRQGGMRVALRLSISVYLRCVKIAMTFHSHLPRTRQEKPAKDKP